jgi:hypothetical protein
MHTTWIQVYGIENDEPFVKYMASLYWAEQTITTVGYGDFRCNVYSEYIISILWMLVGATFYSFLVSNISSLVASMD